MASPQAAPRTRWTRIREVSWVVVTGRVFCGDHPLVLGTGERESPDSCIFKQFVQGTTPCKQVVLEDERTMTIKDIRPAAQFHHLVLPREPIQNVFSLRATDEDIELLEYMREQGKESLRKVGAPGPESSWWIGFHVPPLISVDHLHLHCLAGPFNAVGNLSFKYNQNFYADIDVVLDQLKEMRSGGGQAV